MAKKKPGEEIYDSKLVTYTTKKQHKKLMAVVHRLGYKNMSEWVRAKIDEIKE